MFWEDLWTEIVCNATSLPLHLSVSQCLSQFSSDQSCRRHKYACPPNVLQFCPFSRLRNRIEKVVQISTLDDIIRHSGTWFFRGKCGCIQFSRISLPRRDTYKHIRRTCIGRSLIWSRCWSNELLCSHRIRPNGIKRIWINCIWSQFGGLSFAADDHQAPSQHSYSGRRNVRCIPFASYLFVNKRICVDLKALSALASVGSLANFILRWNDLYFAQCKFLWLRIIGERVTLKCNVCLPSYLNVKMPCLSPKSDR